MAVILKEYLDLQYDRNLVKEAKEKKLPIIVPTILQRADALNQNKRIYPRRILEREVENYKKAVAESRATGECVPAGVEILTENRGWIDIKDINVGENIFTLNVNTNEIEVQSVSEKIYKKYNDDLVRINNKSSIEMLVTKNHLIPMWDRNEKYYEMTALELYNSIKNKDSKVSHSCLRRSGEWKKKDEKNFHIPNTSLVFDISDWAAFLGIYIAEGHSSGTKGGQKTNEVGITQIIGEKQDKIKCLLDKMGIEYKLRQNRQFIINNEELYNHLFALGSSKEKHIPQYAKKWSVENLSTMFEWMLMGDGRNRKDRNGNIIEEYYTISPKLANDVSEILFKIGTGGSITERIPIDREIEGRLILAENSNVGYNIHKNTTESMYLDTRFTSAELISYDDYVYCVRVPNKNWLMRCNGKVSWTHNCDHPDSSIVSLQKVSHIVREIGWNGNEVVGKIEILDTPMGKIIQSLMEAGVKLGISSRGVGETQRTSEGYDMVDESFMLVAFDLVSEPSTHNAWLGLREGKEISTDKIREMISKNDRVNRVVNEILRK